MSNAEAKRLEFTDNRYIHHVGDFYQALDYYFAKSTKKDSQLAGNNLIHHYKFF